MKNALEYFYNLSPKDIHLKDNVYRFTINGINYRLNPCNIDKFDLKMIIYFNNILKSNNVPMHNIYLNNFNEYITLIDGKYYILISYQNGMDKKIELSDIINFHSLTNNIIFGASENNYWNLLWEKKIDYFEYQINQFGKKLPIIRNSFGYYSGIVETGISLFNELGINNKYITFSHVRLNESNTLYDLYDPFNIMLDYKVRDVSEYFKSKYLSVNSDTNLLNEITNYLKFSKLNMNDHILFFIRMFYPSFYFDMYEKIL